MFIQVFAFRIETKYLLEKIILECQKKFDMVGPLHKYFIYLEFSMRFLITWA